MAADLGGPTFELMGYLFDADMLTRYMGIDMDVVMVIVVLLLGVYPLPIAINVFNQVVGEPNLFVRFISGTGGVVLEGS